MDHRKGISHNHFPQYQRHTAGIILFDKIMRYNVPLSTDQCLMSRVRRHLVGESNIMFAQTRGRGEPGHVCTFGNHICQERWTIRRCLIGLSCLHAVYPHVFCILMSQMDNREQPRQLLQHRQVQGSKPTWINLFAIVNLSPPFVPWPTGRPTWDNRFYDLIQRLAPRTSKVKLNKNELGDEFGQ